MSPWSHWRWSSSFDRCSVTPLLDFPSRSPVSEASCRRVQMVEEFYTIIWGTSFGATEGPMNSHVRANSKVSWSGSRHPVMVGLWLLSNWEREHPLPLSYQRDDLKGVGLPPTFDHTPTLCGFDPGQIIQVLRGNVHLMPSKNVRLAATTFRDMIERMER